MYALHCAAGLIDLSLISPEGKHITEVFVEEPFIIEISVHADTPEQWPTVNGLERCTVLKKQLARSIAFNQFQQEKIIRYQYYVQVNKEGEYTFGPASLFVNGSLQRSRHLTVSAKKRATSLNADSVAFYVTNRDAYYVHEEIEIKVCMEIADTSFNEIKLPVIQDKEVTILVPWHEISREQLADGKYRYQWATKIVSKNPTKVHLAQEKLPYTVVQRDGIFQLFRRYVEKCVDIKPLTISILPLPVSDNHLHAIGQAETINMYIDNHDINVGDAVSCVMSVVKNGAITWLKDPIMVLSQEGQSYFSHRVDDDRSTSFHFVIHVLQEGSFTIPAQEITLFDPRKKVVTTLKSTPFSIMAKPRPRMMRDVNVEAYPVKMAYSWWLVVLVAFFPICILMMYRGFKKRLRKKAYHKVISNFLDELEKGTRIDFETTFRRLDLFVSKELAEIPVQEYGIQSIINELKIVHNELLVLRYKPEKDIAWLQRIHSLKQTWLSSIK